MQEKVAVAEVRILVEVVDAPRFNEDERRLIPWTSYPFAIRSSAKYEPSCPATPVISVLRLISFIPVMAAYSARP
jgi:hypothetical protein